jgi:dihydropteroate synthase
MEYPKRYMVKVKCLIKGVFHERGREYVATSEESEPGKETMPFLELIEEVPKMQPQQNAQSKTIEEKRQILKDKGIIGKGNHSEETILKTYEQYFAKKSDESGE